MIKNESSELPNWDRLQELYYLCRRHLGVSLSITWHEATDTFSIEIDSTAPRERFVGRDGEFNYVIDEAKNYLRFLIINKDRQP